MPGLLTQVPDDIDVSEVRRRAGLTQIALASRIEVRVSTLRNWEQKRRAPDGPARVLLAMLDRNPKVVEETLGRARPTAEA